MLGLSARNATESDGMRASKTIGALCAVTMLLAGCHGHGPQGSGPGTQTGNGNPAKPGKGQEVELHWVHNAWKVSLNKGPDQDPDKAITRLDRDTVGPTMFAVDIPNNVTVKFRDTTPLDVWEGDNAKSQPQDGVNSTQILGPIAMNGGKHLIFFDLNQGAAVTLNYRLNFDHGPSVDPIIGNGGHN
jgi:hypothetical protein